MTRCNGRPIHSNRLVRSSPDDVALCIAVEERFIDLCGSYLRIRGEKLFPPADLDGDMMHWRWMRIRHKQGDFRHTEAEKKSLRAIAEWTLRENAILRNQPIPVMDWGD